MRSVVSLLFAVLSAQASMNPGESKSEIDKNDDGIPDILREASGIPIYPGTRYHTAKTDVCLCLCEYLSNAYA